MANQEDIDRAKKGKDVWNAWAIDELKKPGEQRAKVDFSGEPIPTDIDFSGFIFPGQANFEGATFEGEADFAGATFEKRAYFKKATFNGHTSFAGATFEGSANFKGAQFISQEDAKIKNWAIFNNVTFKNTTIFTGATFQSAPWFHNAAIHQDTAFSFGEAFFRQFPDIESKPAERAYRTLKLAMNKYQSHTEEAGFFKLELKARALKQPWRRRWIYVAYGLLSDYGQGILRPFFWWAGLGLAIFVLYALVLGNCGEVATVTMAQALPLIGIEKEALKALFPSDGPPFWFHLTRAVHMLVSSALIFLMLLALRNRFKIK